MNDFPTIYTDAVMIHEIYTSYVAAGFTEEQAFKLLQTHIQASAQLPGDE